MASNGCSNGNWLYITGPSGTAIRFSSNGKSYYGEIRSASSYAASTTPFLHFGLGETEELDKMEVRFRGKDWQVYDENLTLPTSITISK
jgi:ribosomal protein S11